MLLISFPISIGTGLLVGGDTEMMGLVFVFLMPMCHFVFYELSGSNKYYYYYNLGLSKQFLWMSTAAICFVSMLIFTAL